MVVGDAVGGAAAESSHGGSVALASPPVDSPTVRILDATSTCLARWGLGKTTLDDVAREAGLSRATVYRLFPGGKGALLEACGQREVGRLLLELSRRLESAASAEELLVEAMHLASKFLAEPPALTPILEREPEVLLPFLAVDRQGPLLAAAAAFVSPPLVRFLPPDTAAEVVEWAARLVISYTLNPSESIDLTRVDDVRRIARTYLLPGLASAAGGDDATQFANTPPPSVEGAPPWPATRT